MLAALVVVNLYVFVWDKNTSVPAIQKVAENKSPAMAIPALPGAPIERAPERAPAERAPAEPIAPVRPVDAAQGANESPGTAGARRGESIDGKVGKSDTLGRLLKRSGLTAREADEVIRALSGVLDFRTIRAGQTFHIERGIDGRVQVFELVLGKQHTVRAERSDKGDLVGKTDAG